MKAVLILLVSLMTVTVSAKSVKIDFSAAIEQSQQERTQTAEQIQDYLEVAKPHMQERMPLAEAKKNLFRGASESVQLVADVK